MDFIGQFSEKQEINGLLKAEAVVLHKSCNKAFNVIATVKKLSLAGHLYSVHRLFRNDLGYLGKTCKNAFTLKVAQSAEYLMVDIKL